MNELEKKIMEFLFKSEKKTLKNVANLNDPKFVKPRGSRTRINYLKSFDIVIEEQSEGRYSYIYSDTHYYDNTTKIFVQFAQDKGLPRKAGYAIARKKRKEGVTDVKNVFIDDRKKLFKSIEKFIDTTIIREALKKFEQDVKTKQN